MIFRGETGMQALLRFFAVAVMSAGLVLLPCTTQAQHVDDTVPADFKGAVGFGLVGAELGAVIPALVGLDSTWAYLVFPAVGAAGGAVAGYFVLDKPEHVTGSVIALTAGMALVIPALVTTLALTAYSPGDDAPSSAGTVQRSPVAASQLAQRGARPAVQDSERLRLRRRAAAGSGLLRLSEGELALSAPGIAIVPGPRSISGMSLALVSGRF
jgi:hypothetical protein